MIKLGDTGIKSIYVGDRKIKKAYVVQELVYSAGPEKIVLPEGYTRLEYATTSPAGTTVSGPCNTFIQEAGPNLSHWYAEIQIIDVLDSQKKAGIFGDLQKVQTSSSAAITWSGDFLGVNSSKQLCARTGNGSKNTVIGDLGSDKITLEYVGGDIYINGEKQDVSHVVSPVSCGLFGTYQKYRLASTYYYFCTKDYVIMNIYRFKLYSGNNVKLDAIPCTYNGSAGFYDLVNGKTYYNHYNGAKFVAGPILEDQDATIS